VSVCIGGFHVSGSLAMLPSMPPEIMEALELGISIFADEAEKHFERVLREIETMKRELPMDIVEFFCLMPLPGSEDHRDLLSRDV
jgi:hypothetical protein